MVSLALMRNSARLPTNNAIPATDADQDSEPVDCCSQYRSEAFRSTSRVFKGQPKAEQVPPSKASVRRHRAVRSFLEESVANRRSLADTEDLQSLAHDPDEVLQVVQRLKTKHERSLASIERLYYGTPSAHDTDGSDNDVVDIVEEIGPSKPKWTGKPTKPEPFSFSERYSSRQNSIIREKRDAYLNEVKRREEQMISHAFKANPIPRSTSERRCEELHQEQEKRQKENRQQSKARLLLSQRPFAFNERDLAAAQQKRDAKQTLCEQRIRDMESVMFHAKELPWAVKIQMYDHMIAKEKAARSERTQRRARAMLARSSLPKRMALYESTKSVKRKMLRSARSSQSQQAKRFRQRPIPDFCSLQKAFDKRMLQQKQSKMTTVPHAFTFGRSDHQEKRFREELRGRLREDQSSSPIGSVDETTKRRVKRIIKPAAILAIGITKKTLDCRAAVQQQIEARRRRLEDDENALDDRMDQERKRILVERMRPLIKDNRSALDRRNHDAQKQARRDQRESERRMTERLKEMQARVDQTPLLMERATSSDHKQEARRKALIAVRDSLVRAGISDYKRFFDDDELNDLELRI